MKLKLLGREQNMARRSNSHCPVSMPAGALFFSSRELVTNEMIANQEGFVILGLNDKEIEERVTDLVKVGM